MSVEIKARRLSSTTVVAPCNCASEFQDERYGKGMRLYNMSPKVGDVKGQPIKSTCTVCAAERRLVADQ